MDSVLDRITEVCLIEIKKVFKGTVQRYMDPAKIRIVRQVVFKERGKEIRPSPHPVRASPLRNKEKDLIQVRTEFSPPTSKLVAELAIKNKEEF